MDPLEALHAAIDEAPEEPASYLVLADHLQQQGDPRGEVIAMWTTYAKREQLAAARELGPDDTPVSDIAWAYGYVRSFRAYASEDDAGEFLAFLDHASLRHVTTMEIKLGGAPYDDRQWLIDALAAVARGSCRNLTIDSYLRGGNDPPDGEVDLSPLWTALPRITSLVVRARYITPGALASTTLRTLELDGSVEDTLLEPLLAGSMPALRELVLRDTNPAFAARVAKSPLAAQLTKVLVTAAAEDRYEQIGE